MMTTVVTIGRFLESVLGAALYVLNSVPWVVDKILSVNYVLMTWVISVTTVIFNNLLEVWSVVSYTALCLIEDFGVFLTDVNSILHGVRTGFSNAIYAVIFTVTTVIDVITTSVGQLINLIGIAVNSVYCFAVLLCTYTVKLIWGIQYALMLICSSLLLLLQIIPKFCTFIVTGIYNIFRTGIVTTLNGVTNVKTTVVGRSYTFKDDSIHAIKNIPNDAYLGLVLAILMWFALKWLISFLKQRHVRAYIRRILNSFFNSIISFVKLIYTLMKVSLVTVVWSWWQAEGMDEGVTEPLNNNNNAEDNEQHGDGLIRRPALHRTPIAGKSSSSGKDNLEKTCYCCGKTHHSEEPMCAKCISKRLEEELQTEREERICVICQVTARNVLVLPCRHLCMCRTCVEVIIQEHGICPMCRQYIVHAIQVYM